MHSKQSKFVIKRFRIRRIRFFHLVIKQFWFEDLSYKKADRKKTFIINIRDNQILKFKYSKTVAVHDKIFLFFKIILIMIKPYDILIKYEKKSILNIIVKKLFTLQNMIYI